LKRERCAARRKHHGVHDRQSDFANASSATSSYRTLILVNPDVRPSNRDLRSSSGLQQSFPESGAETRPVNRGCNGGTPECSG
jgi:hypothetical protein